MATATSYGVFGTPDGKQFANLGSAGRWQYTGREYDADAGRDGLLYNRARYYDPATQRWMSEDPLGLAAGDANLYRYVFNSPTNFTDPTGKVIPLVVIGGLMLMGAGVGGMHYAAYEMDQSFDAGKDSLGYNYAKMDTERFQRARWIAAGSSVATGTGLAMATGGILGPPAMGLAYAYPTTAAVAGTGLFAIWGYQTQKEARGIVRDWGKMDGPDRLQRLGLLIGENAGGFAGFKFAPRSLKASWTLWGGLTNGIRNFEASAAGRVAGITPGPLAAIVQQDMRARVLANLAASRAARESSGYGAWAARAQQFERVLGNIAESRAARASSGYDAWAARAQQFERVLANIAESRAARASSHFGEPTVEQQEYIRWMNLFRAAQHMRDTGQLDKPTRTVEYAYYADLNMYRTQRSGTPVTDLVVPKISDADTVPGACGVPRAGHDLFEDLRAMGISPEALKPGAIEVSRGGFRWQKDQWAFIYACPHCQTIPQYFPFVRASKTLPPGVREPQPGQVKVSFTPPDGW